MQRCSIAWDRIITADYTINSSAVKAKCIKRGGGTFKASAAMGHSKPAANRAMFRPNQMRKQAQISFNQMIH